MTTKEVAAKLVSLCRAHQEREAMETLYHPDIVSVEAATVPGMPQEVRGMQAVLGKSKWWTENHEVHSAETEGPWPHGDRFAVRFKYDITRKASGERVKLDEIALYTVKDGKIVREEFFYPT